MAVWADSTHTTSRLTAAFTAAPGLLVQEHWQPEGEKSVYVPFFRNQQIGPAAEDLSTAQRIAEDGAGRMLRAELDALAEVAPTQEPTQP